MLERGVGSPMPSGRNKPVTAVVRLKNQLHLKQKTKMKTVPIEVVDTQAACI
jgi:hypothetical protein